MRKKRKMYLKKSKKIFACLGFSCLIVCASYYLAKSTIMAGSAQLSNPKPTPNQIIFDVSYKDNNKRENTTTKGENKVDKLDKIDNTYNKQKEISITEEPYFKIIKEDEENKLLEMSIYFGKLHDEDSDEILTMLDEMKIRLHNMEIIYETNEGTYERIGCTNCVEGNMNAYKSLISLYEAESQTGKYQLYSAQLICDKTMYGNLQNKLTNWREIK